MYEVTFNLFGDLGAAPCAPTIEVAVFVAVTVWPVAPR
jgi:hypothetical protein